MDELPPIKFRETMKALVDESPFKANRKPIWQSVNITSAALSQYLQGQARPRLDTLVGLAQFFGVTLDYLVLGKSESETITNQRPFNSYVDQALLDVQASLGERTWMAARIGQELAVQIETVAARLTAEGSTADGMVVEKDILLLEKYSLETLLMPLSMSFNVRTDPSGEVSVGRFTSVVAQNLNSNPVRSYQFLMPEETRSDWASSVHGFRRLLMHDFGVSKDRMRRCSFRVTNAGMFNGAVFYRLDVGNLHHEEPVLYQLLSSFISPEGWIGYASHLSSSMNNILFSSSALDRALSNFRRHWHESDVEL